MSLWTPPHISRELRDRTREYNAATLDMFELTHGIVGKWNKPNSPLRKFDPLLRLGKAKPQADALNVTPGYYHLIRINPGVPLYVMPLHDGQGGFVEPAEGMIDMLRRTDLQNSQVMRAMKAEKEADAKTKTRDEQNSHEGRVNNMMANWRAVARPSVLVGDGRWSAKAAGKRGRREPAS